MRLGHQRWRRVRHPGQTSARRPGPPGRTALVLALASLLLAPPAPAKKEPQPVRAQPADTYAAHDSHAGITVAAEPYDRREKSKAVFGKYDPLRIGVLPVLVVITNSTQDAVRLDNLEVQFISADRRRVEPTPASTVSLLMKGRKPPRELDPPRYPLPIPRLPERHDSNAIAELAEREFVLQMVPPGETVSGFFFFRLTLERDPLTGARLYLPGLT